MDSRKGPWGIPAWEIAVCLLIAGVMGKVLLERAENVLERAESVAVATTLTHVRSALKYEHARRLLTGRSMDDVAGSNPLDWLQGVPELRLAPPPGQWRFDPLSRELRYRPRRLAHLQVLPRAAHTELAWQILATPGGGAEVVVLTPYQWF